MTGANRRSRRNALLTISALAVSFLLTLSSQAQAATLLLDSSFEALTGSAWGEGSTHGAWKVVFNGYGTQGIAKDGTKVLQQAPKVSTVASETHASLAVTTKKFSNLDLSLKMKTVKQLRTSNPNAWETAWVMWNYTDNTHFYYMILKPNGWELGKGDPAYPGAQRFLATGSSPTYPIARWYTVRVQQVGATMSVWANGVLLTTFTDSERPYTSGAVGLYNEDAQVRFDSVKVLSA